MPSINQIECEDRLLTYSPFLYKDCSATEKAANVILEHVSKDAVGSGTENTDKLDGEQEVSKRNS